MIENKGRLNNNNGTITNFSGAIIVNLPGGEIDNAGLLTNRSGGTIANFGTINNNPGGFVTATLNNLGALNDYGTITNADSLSNSGRLVIAKGEPLPTLEPTLRLPA